MPQARRLDWFACLWRFEKGALMGKRREQEKELGPGLHKIGPEPYAWVFNPAEGLRIGVVMPDGRIYTDTITAFEEDDETGEIKLTVGQSDDPALGGESAAPA